MRAGKTLYHSFLVAWKDLKELSRNRMALAMLILMPLFMMAMVGFVFPSDNSIKDVYIAVANQDQGYTPPTGRSGSTPSSPQPVNEGGLVVRSLTLISNKTGAFNIVSAAGVEEIRERIKRNEIDGGIVIPSNFTRSISTGKQGIVVVVTDQSNPQLSLVLQGALEKILDEIATSIAQRRIGMMNPSLPLNSTLTLVKPYRVEATGAVPGRFSYFDFVAPGLMAMTVMMSVMTGLPAAISHEKEVGTLYGMIVAPINRMAIILGKTAAQTARGLLQGALILVLAITLFGVTIHGSILLIFSLLLLGVFSFVGLGIMITSFARDQETATMVMMTLMFPMMFLSGVFFPIRQMPQFMQMLSKLLPLTYAAQALRKVMVLGAGVSAISLELSVLTGFGAVMIVIAVPVFKKAMSR